jgi:hypothetical protein
MMWRELGFDPSPTHLNSSTSRDKPHDGLIRSLCHDIRLAEQVLSILYFLVSAEDTPSTGVEFKGRYRRSIMASHSASDLYTAARQLDRCMQT